MNNTSLKPGKLYQVTKAFYSTIFSSAEKIWSQPEMIPGNVLLCLKLPYKLNFDKTEGFVLYDSDNLPSTTYSRHISLWFDNIVWCMPMLYEDKVVHLAWYDNKASSYSAFMDRLAEHLVLLVCSRRDPELK